MLAGSLLVASLAALVAAAPPAAVKRQVSQLRDSYDFVVAGGGTSGLTVADRLTEAFPNSIATAFCCPSPLPEALLTRR